MSSECLIETLGDVDPQSTLSEWWSALYQRRQQPKGDRQWLTVGSPEGAFWVLEEGKIVLFIDLARLKGL